MIANKSDRKGITKGRIIICAIFALLFSQVIVAGNRVHYVDIRARYTDNYIAYDASAILIGVLLALIIFPISMLVFEAIRRISSFVALDKESGTISGSFFVIAWMIIGLCWLPYLLTFYPGGLVGDGVEVLKRAITPGFPESAHWSILYALIMRGVLNLASIIFEDINNRVFVYAILEYVIYSGICAYTCFVVRKRGGVFKSFSYGFVLMYAFSGFFATYSFTFWADGIFGALTVFLCLKLWDIADTKSLGMQDALQLFVIELLISLWRNNGIYIIVVVSVGALIVSKKVFARHLVGCILTICIVMLIKGPFYNAMGVYDDATRESIAIPVQQMAAVINSGYELTENEEAVLYSLAPKEIWIDNYCPTLVDDLKFKMDEGYLKTHLGDVLSVWFKLLIPNFDIYVRAYLMETIGFWKLDTFQGNYWDYWYGVEDNYDYGLHERDLISESTGISVRTILTKCMRFISSGTMVWVLLFCVCAILYQGHNYERLLPLFPLLGIWGTVMVAAPIAFAYRYVVALPMALPVIIGVTFAGKSTEICI